MELIKRLALDGLAVLLTAPAILYTVIRCGNVGISCWKMGWASRPFIYISTAGIFVFILYAIATTAGLGWVWRLTKDRFVGFCAVLVAATLFIYWVGLLTWSVGVLPSR